MQPPSYLYGGGQHEGHQLPQHEAPDLELNQVLGAGDVHQYHGQQKQRHLQQ